MSAGVIHTRASRGPDHGEQLAGPWFAISKASGAVPGCTENESFITDFWGTPMMINCLVPPPRVPSRPAPPPGWRRRGYEGCPLLLRYCSHGGRPTWEQYRGSAGAVPSLPAAGPWLPRTTGRWRTGEQALPETITVLNVDTVPVGTTVDVLRLSGERIG
jgi:hypothetical protein